MREPADRLIRAIDYEFRNSGLIDVALTHRSAGSINNERYEFLGDAILGFIIADELNRHSALIKVEFEDGKKINIKIDAITEYVSKITIRVGPIGDHDDSTWILNAIKENL